jgi:hypothetical protein
MNGFACIAAMLGIAGSSGTDIKTFPVYSKSCLVAKVSEINTIAGFISAVFTLLRLVLGALVPAVCTSVLPLLVFRLI